MVPNVRDRNAHSYRLNGCHDENIHIMLYVALIITFNILVQPNGYKTFFPFIQVVN